MATSAATLDWEVAMARLPVSAWGVSYAVKALFLDMAARFILPQLPAQRRERSLRSLYRCSDGVRGLGAPVTYLSHTASFHSNERIAPSNRGIKQKLFFPSETGEPGRRDYTPRHFDNAAQTLTIDFAVHDAGPATRWATQAGPGDILEIGGSRGSAVVAPTFDWWLLIGDETALPAIGRRIEELPKNTPVISIAAVTAASEEQLFTTQASHEAHWVHRSVEQADDPAPLLAALEALRVRTHSWRH